MKLLNEEPKQIGTIVTIVQDNGIGIDVNEQDSVSEGDGSAKKYSGFNIAKVLTNSLGGSINFKSESSKGSCVTFEVQATTYAVKNLEPNLNSVDRRLQIPFYSENHSD